METVGAGWQSLEEPVRSGAGIWELCISREPREKPLHKIIQVSMMPPVFFYNAGNIRRRYFLCGGQAEYCTAQTGGGSYDLSG